MIKKGNRDANVANKGMIETLIVQSEDLVQVVSKASGFAILFLNYEEVCDYY